MHLDQVFRPEATKDSHAEAYEGGRTAADLIAFAQVLAEESQGPVELKELTGNASFDEVHFLRMFDERYF